MNIKKFLAVILSAILVLPFSACGNKQSTDNTLEETSETVKETIAETSAAKIASVSEVPETSTETSQTTETTVTSEIIQTHTETTTQPYGESVSEQKVLMFSLYGNDAWGFQRDVTILDSDGNYCFISHEDEGGEFLSKENGNFLKKDNWYQNLVNALEYGEYTWQDLDGGEHEMKLPDEKLELVKEYAEKFGDHRDAPIRVYGNDAYDYGTNLVYGVYLDENNVPQYVKLCAYGDWSYCVYDEDIADFINNINGYFFNNIFREF